MWWALTGYGLAGALYYAINHFVPWFMHIVP